MVILISACLSSSCLCPSPHARPRRSCPRRCVLLVLVLVGTFSSFSSSLPRARRPRPRRHVLVVPVVAISSSSSSLHRSSSSHHPRPRRIVLTVATIASHRSAIDCIVAVDAAVDDGCCKVRWGETKRGMEKRGRRGRTRGERDRVDSHKLNLSSCLCPLYGKRARRILTPLGDKGKSAAHPGVTRDTTKKEVSHCKVKRLARKVRRESARKSVNIHNMLRLSNSKGRRGGLVH